MSKRKNNTKDSTVHSEDVFPVGTVVCAPRDVEVEPPSWHSGTAVAGCTRHWLHPVCDCYECNLIALYPFPVTAVEAVVGIDIPGVGHVRHHLH